MARYKTAQFQKLYDGILKLAADLSSEMYYNGKPRRGAAVRCAFWDGYAGVRSPQNIPATMGAVCYQAGKQFAKTNPGIQDAEFRMEAYQGGPKPVRQRVAELRARREDAGLVKCEVWAYPDDHERIKAYAGELQRQRDAAAVTA